MSASNLYNFIVGSFRWIPVSFVTMLGLLVMVRFGDSVMGLLDRAWRLIGR